MCHLILRMEYSFDLRIPKERVAVLIGTQGSIKKRIEDESHTTLDIDSEEGEVTLNGTDGVMLLAVKEVVLAIGRGFNPEIALQLLKPDYALEIISIEETKKNHLKRIKGRLIGTAGKARKTIESLTDCNISVFGKTIAMIGPAEKVDLARRAVEMLLQGSPHANVYQMLERNSLRYF